MKINSHVNSKYRFRWNGYDVCLIYITLVALSGWLLDSCVVRMTSMSLSESLPWEGLAQGRACTKMPAEWRNKVIPVSSRFWAIGWMHWGDDKCFQQNQTTHIILADLLSVFILSSSTLYIGLLEHRHDSITCSSESLTCLLPYNRATDFQKNRRKIDIRS